MTITEIKQLQEKNKELKEALEDTNKEMSFYVGENRVLHKNHTKEINVIVDQRKAIQEVKKENEEINKALMEVKEQIKSRESLCNHFEMMNKKNFDKFKKLEKENKELKEEIEKLKEKEEEIEEQDKPFPCRNCEDIINPVKEGIYCWTKGEGIFNVDEIHCQQCWETKEVRERMKRTGYECDDEGDLETSEEESEEEEEEYDTDNEEHSHVCESPGCNNNASEDQWMCNQCKKSDDRLRK